MGAVLVAATLSLPYGIGRLLAAAGLVSLVHLVCQHALGCAPRAIHRLKLESSGVCAVTDGTSPAWQETRVVGWFVHPWLVILRLRGSVSGRRRDILVAWDALPENQFRELRARVYGLEGAVQA